MYFTLRSTQAFFYSNLQRRAPWSWLPEASFVVAAEMKNLLQSFVRFVVAVDPAVTPMLEGWVVMTGTVEIRSLTVPLASA